MEPHPFLTLSPHSMTDLSWCPVVSSSASTSGFGGLLGGGTCISSARCRGLISTAWSLRTELSVICGEVRGEEGRLSGRAHLGQGSRSLMQVLTEVELVWFAGRSAGEDGGGIEF